MSSSPGRPRTDSVDTNKSKGTLVAVAERYPRSSAVMSGYLRKRNSEGKWQKRYFEIVGQYFVYYKSKQSDEMLCALDLWRASAPEMIPYDPTDPDSGADFAITWDRFRPFRAASKAEAFNWVAAMKEVQGKRPGADKRPSIPATIAAAAVSPSRRASAAGGDGAGLGGGTDATAGSGSSKVSEWSNAEKTDGKSGGGKKKKGAAGAAAAASSGKKKAATETTTVSGKGEDKAGCCCSIV
jgi:hypothetical protein